MSSRSASSSVDAGGLPKPPYPFFLGCLGSPNPDLEPFELLVDVRECPPAVAGRCILAPVSAVPIDIVVSFILPIVACLW